MTSLMRARQRADEFQALLDGKTPPAHRADLAPLVTAAVALRDHAPVTPRPDFTASLRAQLMVEAATVLTGDAKNLVLPVRRHGARERRFVAAATAAMLLGGTAGMATASQRALPGDTLYAIKRTLERAEAGLNTNDEGRGRDLLAQANDRLQEARGLLTTDGRQARELPSTIDDFSAQAHEGSVLLMQAFEQDRDAAMIATVRSFTADSLVVLQDLARTAPPAAQEALASAASLLQDLDSQALTLCSFCAEQLPPLEIEELLLSAAATTEVERALARAAKQLGADATATGDAEAEVAPAPPVSAPTPAPSAPAPSSPPPTTTGDSGAKTTVDSTKQDVKATVDETVEPVEELVEQLLPGVGDLLGKTVDGVGSGLLGTTD